jgi:hypothetical protein
VGHGTKCWRDNCLSGFGTTRTRILKDKTLKDKTLKDKT